MNSTDEALAAVMGPLFDEVLLPLAQRQARAPFALAPDPGWLSYYVRRKRSQMRHDDFLSASCVDAQDLAQRLASHWRALGREELALAAPHFAAAADAARTLLADSVARDEVNPYVYAMF